MEMQARIFCGTTKILSVLMGNWEGFPGKILNLWLFLLLFHTSLRNLSKSFMVFFSVAEGYFGSSLRQFFCFSELILQKMLLVFVTKYMIKGYSQTDVGSAGSAHRGGVVGAQKSLSGVSAPRL